MRKREITLLCYLWPANLIQWSLCKKRWGEKNAAGLNLPNVTKIYCKFKKQTSQKQALRSRSRQVQREIKGIGRKKNWKGIANGLHSK